MSPKRARSVCNVIGCPNLAVKNGRCELHRVEQRRAGEARRTPRPRGLYGAEWEVARLIFLREHPFCIVCGGPATVVDHRIPHRGDPDLFWRKDLWDPMCERDHNAKTAREDGGFGNARKAGGDVG